MILDIQGKEIIEGSLVRTSSKRHGLKHSSFLFEVFSLPKHPNKLFVYEMYLSDAYEELTEEHIRKNGVILYSHKDIYMGQMPIITPFI